MRRPALRTASAFAVGVMLARFLSPPPSILLISSVLLVLLCILLRKFGRSEGPSGTVLFFVLFVSSGALRYVTSLRLPPDHIGSSRYFGLEVALRGKVTESSTTEGGWTRVEVDLKEVDGRRLKGKVLILARKGPPPPPGSLVEAYGLLRRPRVPRNPGEPDTRATLERRGIYGVVYTGSLEVVGRGGGLPALRSYIRRALEVDLPELHSCVLKGLVLGERVGLPGWLRETFARSGTSHILAVSGLHVGFIAALIFFLLRTLRVPRRVTVPVTLGVLTFYAFLVDLRPSVLRAVVLASLVLSGTLLERDSDLLNGLGAAALVVLGFRPRDLMDTSFQLSFSAVAAIALLYRPIYAAISKVLKGKILGRVSSLMAVSISAQLGTAPVLAYHFGRLSLVGPLVNLLAVPMAGGTVALGMLSALSYPIWPGLSSAWNGANYLLISGLVASVKLASSLPLSSVRLPSPSPSLLFGYAAALLSLSPDTGWRPVLRKVLLFSGLVSLNIWAWGGLSRPKGLEVHFLDLGKGEASFVRLPDGRNLLVGRWDERRWRRVVSPFLRHKGVEGLDLVVATGDIGGPVRKHFKVGYIVSLEENRRGGTSIASPGDSLVGFGILVLGRGSFKLSYRGFSVLFVGDDEEGHLLRWGRRLRADLLRLGRKGASPRLVGAVRPRVIVTSGRCGGGLQARVLCLRRTGAVSIYVGKGRWKVNTML